MQIKHVYPNLLQYGHGSRAPTNSVLGFALYPGLLIVTRNGVTDTVWQPIFNLYEYAR